MPMLNKNAEIARGRDARTDFYPMRVHFFSEEE
jgi:hypothetical protein